MTTAEERKAKVETAAKQVEEARKVLREAEQALTEARHDLYQVRFQDINAMELSHIVVWCGEERLTSLEYGWSHNKSHEQAAAWLVSELLREGALLLASEVEAGSHG